MFWQNRGGVTSIEYAVIAAGISVAIVVTVGELADPVDGLIGQVKTAWDANFGS
ncbi:MAG: Flp family type IVb pilin [Methyloligellaceae bacterium]